MTHRILQKTHARLALCWLGNLSWLIRAGDRLFATDLDLDRQGRMHPSPIPTDEIAPHLDVHMITHGHEDHFSTPTSRILVERSDCTFIVPTNCEAKARGLGIAQPRLHIARPGEPFDLPGVHVEPRRALHGHLHGSVYHHANLQDCGYLFTVGGQRCYQPGDTVLLHEHLELAHVDVLFVSPTEHNTHVDRSAIMIGAIKPAYILPQHFGTYVPNDDNRYWTVGYPDELCAALSAPMRERFHKLALGEVYTIE
jgi:L-ascorbate metabolism protein UlaG (beta-lactamase superfamily)